MPTKDGNWRTYPARCHSTKYLTPRNFLLQGQFSLKQFPPLVLYAFAIPKDHGQIEGSAVWLCKHLYRCSKNKCLKRCRFASHSRNRTSDRKSTRLNSSHLVI